jgi:hypothetical protein
MLYIYNEHSIFMIGRTMVNIKYSYSVHFFIIHVSSHQLQGQLQTQYSVDTVNHIKDKHNVKTKDKLQASTGESKDINTGKVNKQKQR